MMDDLVAIGLDIGGTNIRIGTRAKGQELQYFEKAARADVLVNADSGLCLARFIRDYLKRNNLEGRVVAIAAGFPSTLSADRRTILQTPNIANMDSIPMADILEQELGCKVFLERDVNLIFEWDSHSRQFKMDGACVGIYFGTGIGNAIFIDGQPLTGHDGCAGEIGHIPVAGRHDVCGCGNTGCTECYASGHRLSIIRDQYFPQTAIQDLFKDHQQAEVLREFVGEMACVVATEVNILNPAYVVLGGGVMTMADFPRKLLEERIHFHCRKPFPDQNLQLYFAAESQQAGVLGALSMAWKLYQKSLEAEKC
jgi:allose kinase